MNDANTEKRGRGRPRNKKTYVPHEGLPKEGFVRQPTILALFPVSASMWRYGYTSGKYPKPVSLGPRTLAWKVEDIRALLAEYGCGTGDAEAA